MSAKGFALWVVLLGLGPLMAASEPKPMRLGEMYELLDRACYYGDEGSVEALLRAGADPSGVKGYADFHHGVDHVGLEPTWHLFQAAYGGHLQIVSQLLRAGADPNLACGEDETALTIAAEKGHLKIVRLLLAAGAGRNHKSASGTALQIARKRADIPMTRLLLSPCTGRWWDFGVLPPIPSILSRIHPGMKNTEALALLGSVCIDAGRELGDDDTSRLYFQVSVSQQIWMEVSAPPESVIKVIGRPEPKTTWLHVDQYEMWVRSCRPPWLPP